MSDNDHEAAKRYAGHLIERLTSPSGYRLAKSYLDMVKQRDELKKALEEANHTLLTVADAIESTHGDDALYRRGYADIARMGAGSKA